MKKWNFEWDIGKENENLTKHGVAFDVAQKAFNDPLRVIAVDQSHSGEETRYFCFAMIDENVVTIRFTFREDRIRVFGAGYWRKGRKAYEEKNSLH